MKQSWPSFTSGSSTDQSGGKRREVIAALPSAHELFPEQPQPRQPATMMTAATANMEAIARTVSVSAQRRAILSKAYSGLRVPVAGRSSPGRGKRLRSRRLRDEQTLLVARRRGLAFGHMRGGFAAAAPRRSPPAAPTTVGVHPVALLLWQIAKSSGTSELWVGHESHGRKSQRDCLKYRETVSPMPLPHCIIRPTSKRRRRHSVPSNNRRRGRSIWPYG
jgi:hypothetical protein